MLKVRLTWAKVWQKVGLCVCIGSNKLSREEEVEVLAGACACACAYLQVMQSRCINWALLMMMIGMWMVVAR